ncbi:MAG: hypothetical protein AB1391_01210 [Candidatus Micrarchaeota archaeon]
MAAACIYAPHSNISEHNNALAPLFLNSTCVHVSSPTYSNPIICAEISLLTLYPSVDDRISSNVKTYALWRYAYKAADEDETISNDCCTSHYYKIFKNASVFANLSAFFRNQTYSANIVDQNPVNIPILQNILNASEWDNATFILDGTITFHYILNAYEETPVYDENDSCSCISTHSNTPFDITRGVKSNLTYIVESGSPLYFLNKPILREQWSKNSLLEQFSFANMKFACVGFFKGDQELGIANLYSFNITNDSLGVWGIISSNISDSVNITVQEVAEKITPIQFEAENRTYQYTYVFNTTYIAYGVNQFSLNITDHFNSNYTTAFKIANRLLTHHNLTAENGSTNITNLDVYRPSAPHSEIQFSIIVGNISLIGVLIVLLFLIKNRK